MASLATVSFVASPASVSLPRVSSTSKISSSPCAGFSAITTRTCPSLRLRIVAMANPSSDIKEVLSQRIKEAEEVCVADSSSRECAVAWDEVEELSAEIAHKRVKQEDKKDPLEEFCKDAPEADECRVYED